MSIQEDLDVARELAEIANIDLDRADSVLNGFKRGCGNLDHMREYWNAKTAKEKAKVVKKHWL